MNARTFLGWAGTLLGALGFAAAGLAKLFAPSSMRDVFVLFGLPAWTIPTIGVAELIGVVLVFTPQRRWGAMILAIIALGAFFEHTAHGQLGRGFAPLILGILVVGGVALRTPDLFSFGTAAPRVRS